MKKTTTLLSAAIVTGAITLAYLGWRHKRYHKLSFVHDYPYDSSLFTQGIEVINGKIIVSTGLYEESKVGYLDPFTGHLTQVVHLEPQYFGEGLTFDGEYLWQLTWKEHTCFVRDPVTFQIMKTFTYDTEGWGICFDGSNLFTSDGSATVAYRSREDFSILRTIEVHDQHHKTYPKINELEYVDGYLYANVFKTNLILKIDAQTGLILKIYDGSALVKHAKQYANQSFNVLNGIAHVEGNKFLITGKLWPRLYLVELD